MSGESGETTTAERMMEAREVQASEEARLGTALDGTRADADAMEWAAEAARPDEVLEAAREIAESVSAREAAAANAQTEMTAMRWTDAALVSSSLGLLDEGEDPVAIADQLA